MRLGPLLLALAITAVPVLSQAQDGGLSSDEQILIRQVMADKKAVYARNLGLTDAESAKFWPIYDDYEAKVKKLDDRFVANVDTFAQKYDTLTDKDAEGVLKEKMAIEKERSDLKQAYTRKIAKVLPPKKALRYAQLETRIEIMLRRNVYSLIPLAR
jgi:hypothetical protein